MPLNSEDGGFENCFSPCAPANFHSGYKSIFTRWPCHNPTRRLPRKTSLPISKSYTSRGNAITRPPPGHYAITRPPKSKYAIYNQTSKLKKCYNHNHYVTFYGQLSIGHTSCLIFEPTQPFRGRDCCGRTKTDLGNLFWERRNKFAKVAGGVKSNLHRRFL